MVFLDKGHVDTHGNWSWDQYLQFRSKHLPYEALHFPESDVFQNHTGLITIDAPSPKPMASPTPKASPQPRLLTPLKYRASPSKPVPSAPIYSPTFCGKIKTPAPSPSRFET